MAETAHPWPEFIHQSFNIAMMTDVDGHDETVFYGPLLRLLYTLFSLDGPYEIVPLCKPLDSSQSDFVPVFIVRINQRPVFFMEIKPPSGLFHLSKREEADLRMRRRFRDLGRVLTIPTLHGVSAFGNHLSFYEYDTATSYVQPEQIPRGTGLCINNTAPMQRWDCDVLKPEGANRLKDVVEKVKEMSGRVGGMSAHVGGYGQVCKVTIV